MGMGIVSDSDFESEIGKLNPSVSQNGNGKSIAIIKEIEKGRGERNLEVPENLRKLIGEESVINGRQEALTLAGNFGISPSSVSAYANGSRSTASYENQPDLSHLNEAKLRVARKARSKLFLALNNLTKDKIETAKAKDIAGVAKDMSAIIKNMEPEIPKNNNGNGGPTFIFYSPQFRKEEVFDVINVKE
jgi:predicted transcriptional regulator